MPAVKLDLIENSDVGNGNFMDYQIEQGSSYRALLLSLPGDRTLGTFQGEIRDDYVDQGGQLLATFSFLPTQYNPENGESSLEPYILAVDTAIIPPTNNIGSTAIGIRNGGYYVYDIYYVIDPTDRVRVYYGLVQVTPMATELTAP